MKDNNGIDYIKLAMDLSNGSFAWTFIGCCRTVYKWGMKPVSPDAEARDYLLTFHAEALESAEANSLETSTVGN
tara:strand:- start:938 stop:1159 length:222 start_codon:yes stop_codon:yes gene_type:complete